jgi:hypothetical protein
MGVGWGGGGGMLERIELIGKFIGVQIIRVNHDNNEVGLRLTGERIC